MKVWGGLIFFTLILTSCTEKDMVNRSSPTTEQNESLEKYVIQKEAELQQGKKSLLLEELKSTEQYLIGVANYEIADTVENSHYLYQKTKILRRLLGLPLNQTLDTRFNNSFGLQPLSR
ncbi:TPA: hypothetical protein HA241_00285 [Candidatus Woesearchaeota archaeon]|nr:hypothetical protein [Candidatus Woesearchaeota archaeon]